MRKTEKDVVIKENKSNQLCGDVHPSRELTGKVIYSCFSSGRFPAP